MQIKMKKIILIFSAVAFLASCKQKELCYQEHPHGQQVNVVFNWPGGVTPPAQGMRTNLFALGQYPGLGVKDYPSTGGKIRIPYDRSYFSVCYDYFGSEDVLFRNEDNQAGLEAYTTAVVRATYSRSFPTENTVAEPSDLYTGKVASFSVPREGTPDDLIFYPENVVKTYTFEITGVRGARFITATRGAISGMSASHFISTGSLAATSSTILFNASKDGDNNRITGTFKTFGRLNETNTFTIEILYPSVHEGIIQLSWDVTDQMALSDNFHLDINADVDIIPDANGGGSAFDILVTDWEDVYIPLPM